MKDLDLSPLTFLSYQHVGLSSLQFVSRGLDSKVVPTNSKWFISGPFKINCLGQGFDRRRQPQAFCLTHKHGLYIFRGFFLKKREREIYNRDLM